MYVDVLCPDRKSMVLTLMLIAIRNPFVSECSRDLKTRLKRATATGRHMRAWARARASTARDNGKSCRRWY